MLFTFYIGANIKIVTGGGIIPKNSITLNNIDPLLIRKIKTLQEVQGYRTKEEFLVPIIEKAIKELAIEYKLEETFKKMK